MHIYIYNTYVLCASTCKHINTYTRTCLKFTCGVFMFFKRFCVCVSLECRLLCASMNVCVCVCVCKDIYDCIKICCFALGTPLHCHCINEWQHIRRFVAVREIEFLCITKVWAHRKTNTKKKLPFSVSPSISLRACIRICTWFLLN